MDANDNDDDEDWQKWNCQFDDYENDDDIDDDDDDDNDEVVDDDDDDNDDDDWQRATQGPDQSGVVIALGETDHTTAQNVLIIIVNVFTIIIMS